MLPATLLLFCVAALEARAQKTTTKNNNNDNSEFYSTTFSTLSSVSQNAFTGSHYTYLSYNGQSTVDTSSTNASETTSSTSTQRTRTSTSQSLTRIGGNNTATSTSTGPSPSNTVPCNGYPEFCQRQYSNLTQICAHNSAFAIPNNAGSNQIYPITTQLDDGVRMLQGETLWVNQTLYNCHTTCDLLNAGTWQSSLELLANWLARNPYDVVTWLIGNTDFIPVEHYIEPIQNSGVAPYLYTPEFVPQHRNQWPTLAEMILSNQRLVLFMDYNANQSSVPYILDQYSHIWETPFSPTNRSFPCTIERPPKLKDEKARDQYMYLANHNLNTAVDLSSLLGSPGGGKQEVILIPNTADINETNGAFDQFGQLEAMRLNCTEQWSRPPNFLVVDYYNFGVPRPGSVFEVAARANGVEYNRKCCGPNASGAGRVRQSTTAVAVVAVAVVVAAVVGW